MSKAIACVVIDGAVYGYDRYYDYLIPEQKCADCKPGCRVTVPFGKGNTVRSGTVIKIGDYSGDKKLKALIDVLDKEPILNSEMLSLIEFMRERTFCTYSEAIRALLPFGFNLKLVTEYKLADNYCGQLTDDMENIKSYISKNGSIKREKLLSVCGLESDSNYPETLCKDGFLIQMSNAVRRMGDASIKMCRLADGYYDGMRLTPKQMSVVDTVMGVGSASIKEICYFTGVTAAVIKSLESKNVLELFDQPVLRPAYCKGKKANKKEITLSQSQARTYYDLSEIMDRNKAETALLYGVTGSGKTSVYLKLTDKAIAEGKGVIVMVPEISLTPQTLSIFNDRYSGKIAVFHSAMSQGQRMDEYKRVKSGKAVIAVGTRSAVFAPFENLGLIIMDEEQEHTYKSEMSPRFHARDIAKFRANHHNCLLLLASATPAVESYANAKSGRYRLCKLSGRYGNAKLPQVVTVDMKNEMLSGNAGPISSELKSRIEKTLNEGNQCVILLNRRGHNTYISCPSCGYVAGCPNCSISMTYHSANKRMMCHYCGYSEPALERCPQCNNKLRYFGIGTQRVEEELSVCFPDARILRMDADSISTKNGYAQKLDAFAKGEYNILLGTQMVAKGLDFPKVTLVGVLGADSAGYSEDFRSFERTFSLLTQVVGRSGRGDIPGTAVIQTYDPKSRMIELASKQDYDAFFSEEILSRKLMTYPPYCDIVTLSAISGDKGMAKGTADLILSNIKEKVAGEYKNIKVIILGPVAPGVSKINNRYRYRIIVKCRINAEFRKMIRQVLDEISKNNIAKNTSVIIDVNPQGNM